MPVANRSHGNTDFSNKHPNTRAYTFHGIQLEASGAAVGHMVGTCPFCGREGKFSVDCDTGLYQCWGCKAGGNPMIFVRTLYERVFAAAVSHTPTTFATIAQDRRLCNPATVRAWGVCADSGGVWLVPGYNPEGRLDQVYRRTRIMHKGRWEYRLLPTPGLWPEGKAHMLHMPVAGGDWDATHERVVICEGPWDAMAYWEVLHATKATDTNVIAVPGCNVWRDEWTAMCAGKDVVIAFDSDHPRELVAGSGNVSRAGYDGVVRIAKRLNGAAKSVQWLQWGPDGYDATRPDGWDVRDHLSRTGKPGDDRLMPMAGRKVLLDDLVAKFVAAPAEWFSAASAGVGTSGGPHRPRMEPMACDRWDVCLDAWMAAMHWRNDLSDALSVLLAVCASTQQAGNQLFLQLVGSAGSGKTTLCDGLLVSQNCYHLEHLTGFFSGYKKAGEEGKDCSLIARANGKTLITAEADVLMSSPRFTEIMAQQRRIFDGKSTSTYKNLDEDRMYEGLRTPWIMAGTPAMMDHDQSHLGDRFLRFIISDPLEGDEKRKILRSAVRAERAAMLETVCGASVVDPLTRRAHALTGGYVDWLRAHVEEELPKIHIPITAEDYCIDLAELSADMRARPNADLKKLEPHDTKELPTRLARQNIRMAAFLAVAMNKPTVDSHVLRVVRKVALDTASGHTQNIVKWLCMGDPKNDNQAYQDGGGLAEGTIEMWTAMPTERLKVYITFLRKIDVLERGTTVRPNTPRVKLTERVYNLYQRIM